MKIFITGASGYIGGMLADRYAERDDVEELICLDKNPMPARYRGNSKVLWIRANTADDSWQELVASRRPDIVIHCAWQIREFYFRKKLHQKWNLDGTSTVFRFVFDAPGIKKFIHMSTVAAYGAYPDNTVERPFVESDPLREDEYLYGVQKKLSEIELEKQYTAACGTKDPDNIPDVTVFRVASVTGARYAQAKRGFTLQNILARIPYIPIANPEWGRQFVQESDLLRIIEIASTVCHPRAGGDPEELGNTMVSGYSVFNVAPPTFLKATDIVKAYSKRAVYVPKELLRVGFFILRHLSLGRLPTSRGGWRSYVYPLAVDGCAVMRKYDYEYLWK